MQSVEGKGSTIGTQKGSSNEGSRIPANEEIGGGDASLTIALEKVAQKIPGGIPDVKTIRADANGLSIGINL